MKQREKLTSKRILETAIKLLDSQGERSFSMRKLASTLSVDPMAIYYHFANKSDLIHNIMETMMQECEVHEPTDNWKQDIRDLCNGLRRVAQSHPGAFCVYETYERWVPADHRFREALHKVLLNAGFAPREAVRAARVLLAYTEAVSVDEVSGWLDPLDRADLAENLSAGNYPTLIALFDEITNIDADAEFDFGLNTIISGLEQQIT